MEPKNVSLNKFVFEIYSPALTKIMLLYGKVNIKITKPTSPGTEEQNRAMHALLMEYYKTGLHSAPEGTTLAEFKIFMKIEYGPCYECEYKGHQIKAPKSWADYSKDERRDFIDGLISEIHQSCAYSESDRIQEIIEGMEQNNKIKHG